MSTHYNIAKHSGVRTSSGGGGGGKEEQTKSVTITENGTTIITPDQGKTLSSVEVNTAVSSSGGAVGRGVYYDTLRTYPRDWHKVEPFISGTHATFRIPNNMDIGVVVSTDGLEPNIYDYSNFLLSLDNVLNLQYGVGFLYEQDGNTYTAEIFVETPLIPQ